MTLNAYVTIICASQTIYDRNVCFVKACQSNVKLFWLVRCLDACVSRLEHFRYVSVSSRLDRIQNILACLMSRYLSWPVSEKNVSTPSLDRGVARTKNVGWTTGRASTGGLEVEPQRVQGPYYKPDRPTTPATGKKTRRMCNNPRNTHHLMATLLRAVSYIFFPSERKILTHNCLKLLPRKFELPVYLL